MNIIRAAVDYARQVHEHGQFFERLGRIEITTHQDTCRVFLEPRYIETSPGGDPVSYRRVEEPFVREPSWWHTLKEQMRAAW